MIKINLKMNFQKEKAILIRRANTQNKIQKMLYHLIIILKMTKIHPKNTTLMKKIHL